jgi:glycosyltransferase involved in cell wall biosynthesis
MSTAPTQSWSIIILCYNEEGSIKKVIEDALNILKIISVNSGQIVVVNDGSSDDSHKIISDLTKKNDHITYINHLNNKGIGKSLHAGYQNAVEENVIMIPGDNQFNLDELIPYKNLQNNSFISFYRVDNQAYSKSRKWLSAFNRFLNRFTIRLRLKDVNWVKAYKNESLKKLNLKIESSLVESEICSKLVCIGNLPIEIQSTYHPRLSGNSQGASYKIIKQALLETPKLIWVCFWFKVTQRSKIDLP